MHTQYGWLSYKNITDNVIEEWTYNDANLKLSYKRSKIELKDDDDGVIYWEKYSYDVRGRLMRIDSS